MYFKGTLDKLGIQFEVEHMGKYKDAGDMLTRKDMSPETKESLNALLDGIWSDVTATIGPARRMKPEQFRALVDEAPFLAPAALQKGLVDELSYLPAVQRALALRAGLAEPVFITPQLLLGDMKSTQKSQRIAYLVAEGDILRSAPDNPWGGDIGITPAPVARLVKSIADDSTIKGVIVRVESPGGDAIASDEILQALKELSRKKPVVVSMSDVAASGGYYISMTGDPVVAYANTITGSIGVIYGKANLKGLYDKLGFSTETLQRGKYADIDSATKPLSPEGRKKLQESLQSIYSGFLKRVAAGRRSRRREDRTAGAGPGMDWHGRLPEPPGRRAGRNRPGYRGAAAQGGAGPRPGGETDRLPGAQELLGEADGRGRLRLIGVPDAGGMAAAARRSRKRSAAVLARRHVARDALSGRDPVARAWPQAAQGESAGHSQESARFILSKADLWICETRLSLTPRVRPMARILQSPE